ncbi:MAG: Rv3212 family protein [Pseudonocardia sp.]
MSRVVSERRSRRDLVAVGALVAVAVLGAALLWWRSPVAATTSVVAAAPVVAPPAADRMPPGFVLGWRAPSGATRAPVVAGPAVVTAEGSAVVGRDAQTGAVAWSYERDLPLCTAGAGFPSADGGIGRVFALHRNGEYCSELTTLRPDTGARAAQRNADARPGASLLADAELVALTDATHAEVLRSPDLVRTLEFGDVPAPEQPGRQPRTGCAYGSFLFAAGRIGVVERCPDEATDRLTVLAAAGADAAESPESLFSMPLPATGAVAVAQSASRTAVALPGPPRLLVVDEAGREVAVVPLGVPAVNVTADLRGGTVPAAADDRHRYWWTGTHTVALDAVALTPVWTLPGTLGAGVPYAGALLVPVPDGLVEVDPSTGAVRRTITVARTDRDAPVVLAALRRVLLEQRGPEVVALLPWG